MVMNCFPSYDNLVVLLQKNLFRSATSFANYQRTRLVWVHKPIANGGGHSEIVSSCGGIWVENPSHPTPDRKKCKAIFWLRAQIKHWGGLPSFWKSIAGGLVRPEFYCHYFHGWQKLKRQRADSPFEIQINFAHRLSNSFSKPILLSEIAQSSWQRTSRERCYHLNLWG